MEEFRTGVEPLAVETAINLKADLKIPKEFVSDEAMRLRIYKGIASCRTEEEVDARYQDLEDRLGALPRPVENLLEYARLRVLGRVVGAQSINLKRDSVDIAFDLQARVEPDRIVQLIERHPDLGFLPPATLSLGTGVRGPVLFERIQNVLRELS